MATSKNPTFRVGSMQHDLLTGALMAGFVNVDIPGQSVSVYLPGANSAEPKAEVRAALQAAIVALDA